MVKRLYFGRKMTEGRPLVCTLECNIMFIACARQPECNLIILQRVKEQGGNKDCLSEHHDFDLIDLIPYFINKCNFIPIACN